MSRDHECDVKLENFRVACEQALHLAESREVTREQHAIGDAILSSCVLFARHKWRVCQH